MKLQTVTNLTFVPSSGPQAFAASQPEIDAVPDSELLAISVDIPFAHQIVLAAADRIDELFPQLAQLPYFDIERVRKVRQYAAACQHTHLLATTPEVADPRLPARIEEAVELRAKALGTVEVLAQFGLVSAARVAAIRSGAGHIDLANDLEQLGVLLDELPASVIARTLVTPEMIVRAPELAHELHVLLGVRRFGTTAVDDPQRVRQRAYTLLVRAYEECRRGVAFLRAPFGDADLMTPSIYLKQRRRTASSEVESPEEPAEVPGPEPTPAPAGTTELAVNR